jgi:outer membrane usher protein
MARAIGNSLSLSAALLILVGVVALASAAPRPALATNGQPAAEQPQRTRINPTGRTLSLIVEIRERDHRLGEAAIKIAPDDTLSVNRQQFARATATLLSEAEAARLAALPAKGGFIALTALNHKGFKTRFHPSAMRLQFTPTPEQRPRRSVRLSRSARRAGSATATPARFSGYVNLRAATDYVGASSGGAAGLSAPRADLETVLRWEDVVLETELTYDGAADTAAANDGLAFTGFDGFTRRGTRLVYDRPEAALRFQAGDINPPITSLQRGPDLLGVSVERSPRKLRPGENIRPTGQRSFRLARPATVKIELNGAVVRQLRLDPGTYDLEDLPLQAGANDVRLIITDDLGEQRTLSFTSYFDAALLAQGAREWGFAAGALSRFDDGGLAYDFDSPIATGYYRRGLSQQVTGQAHVQAGRDAAMAGASVYTATTMGFFGVDAGLSYHRDLGPGGVIEIDWDALRDKVNGSNLRLSAELRSDAFARPSEDNPLEDYWLSLLASYSRTLPLGIHANLSGRYAFASDNAARGDAYSVAMGMSTRVYDSMGLGLSLSYSSDPLDSGFDYGTPDDTGELRAALSLSWRPGARSSVATRYESGSARASVNATMTAPREPGGASWSASIETIHDNEADKLAFDGGLSYAGSRAVFSLDHTSSLATTNLDAGLPPPSDQRTSFRLGTSLAFADGHFALGAPITGSFAILAPHESLADHTVVLGETAAPRAGSDLFGPPLVRNLPAYMPRTLRYDVEDLPIGYDLGKREFTLEPPYKAGYALTVGSARSVTAFGTLVDGDGAPVALLTGTATPDDGGEPVSLFTNTAGRFGGQGLAPGHWRIEMASDPVQHFILDIPDGTTGLYRAGTLTPVAPEGT